MRVAILSAHRDSAGRVPAHLERIAELREFGHEVRVIAAEGDSRDGRTRAALAGGAQRFGLPIEFVHCSHGGPSYGSTEEPARMRALSIVLNAAFEAVRPGDDEVVVWVESDLAWDPAVLHELICCAFERPCGFHVIAPMVMAGRAFYDIWGFRDLNGNRFAGPPPFHPELEQGSYLELSSAGSCLAMRAEVAAEVRVQNGNALVGWCEQARALGHRIAVSPWLAVEQR